MATGDGGIPLWKKTLMRPKLRYLCLIAIAAACAVASGAQSLRADEPALKPIAAGTPAPAFMKDVRPLLAKFCFECHQGEKAKGGLALDLFRDERAALGRQPVWEKVLDQLDTGMMPPDRKPQPTDDERGLVMRWIESRVLKIDCSKVDPGRVTIRRLNKSEYNNTIRDLIGVDIKPADDFPSDDVGYGFDHIGDVLSMPPVLLERYLAAAERVVDAAILTPDPERAPVRTGKGKNLGSVGDADFDMDFPRTGDYVLRVRAFADQAGPEPARMALRLDGLDLQTVDVMAADGVSATYEIMLNVPAGKHRFAARFLNDYYKPDDPDPKNRDRNLHVERLEIQGPIGLLPDPLPASHTRLITCQPAPGTDPADCARAILRPFATRAFRRPATDDEVERLARLVAGAVREGDSFERGVQVAVEAVLVSPHFLFRIELDPEPLNPQAIRTINDFELATRLSYFLWSSLPDDELLGLAQAGTLRKEGHLAAQVKRMLQDPKSRALVDHFAVQWLQLGNLKTVSPDRKQFPGFDAALRSAMETETRRFFEAIIREDHSLFELLDADFTFLNERLAKHYGIDGVQGDEFRRVTLTNPERGGLLGQASILTVTSNPTRTSPVKRGKWILENLLNAAPPPPPPNVPELKDAGEKQLEGTLRQRMEQHRENPACAVCHTQMDAIGFGLENYDPIGAWRAKEGNLEIDASGTLPGGASFKSPAELKTILKARDSEFRRCLTEKLLTYALGRGLEYYDKCTVDTVVRNVATNHDRFSALVLEIVNSDAFQKRRGKRGDEL
jgi:Protein of unknown function (DUF1592)/Protein of unknown function (DUF1588)/Protein of unknown function (DUF1587)/Protein of unknown function (DUF1585)/Protein of unknown function (DUF1595)/Ca-dependent carbohydrate-binding module xylan-binding/Planctomycete cytochrome C